MTVCVAVAVNDCLVFAADSASSIVATDPTTGESRIINVYQHGDKVYNLYRHLPISAMTCGMGNIGSASIGTLAKELRRRLMSEDPDWHLDPVAYTIEEVAVKARKLLFEEKFAALVPPPPAPHSLEFWIGGYPSGFDTDHEIWKVAVLDGSCDAPEQLLSGGMGLFVGGQPGPVNRLVTGFDHRLYDGLLDAGMSQADASGLITFLRPRLQAQLTMQTMPVKDAIALADFLVETTKRFFRFLPGADVVGGDTDIAVVTRYEGFKWIRRKHFYPAELNPTETNHA